MNLFAVLEVTAKVAGEVLLGVLGQLRKVVRVVSTPITVSAGSTIRWP